MKSILETQINPLLELVAIVLSQHCRAPNENLAYWPSWWLIDYWRIHSVERFEQMERASRPLEASSWPSTSTGQKGKLISRWSSSRKWIRCRCSWFVIRSKEKEPNKKRRSWRRRTRRNVSSCYQHPSGGYIFLFSPLLSSLPRRHSGSSLLLLWFFSPTIHIPLQPPLPQSTFLATENTDGHHFLRVTVLVRTSLFGCCGGRVKGNSFSTAKIPQ